MRILADTLPAAPNTDESATTVGAPLEKYMPIEQPAENAHDNTKKEHSRNSAL